MKMDLRTSRRVPRSALGYAAAASILLASASASAQAAAASGASEPASQAPFAGFSDEQRAELDSYIDDALGLFEVPGAVVAVLQNGHVAYRGAFGVRGDRHPAPVDARTLFMVGSVTKSMTATMIGTLVDDGLLDWDAAVRTYLPDFELAVSEYSEEVTLRHLLSHTSGVSRADVTLFLGPQRPLQLLDEVATFPVHAPPGQSYEYQNQLYALSGFVAASAVGAPYSNRGLSQRFERLMHERLFAPAGMRQTTLDFEDALRSPNHAWPNEYSPLEGRVSAVQPGYERFASNVPAAGGVWSTLDDMARYAVLQLSEGRNVYGRRVLSEAALRETHTAVLGDAQGGYGLGWGVFNGPQGTIIQHNGGTAGFGCDVLLAPDADFGVVVLTNRASSVFFIQAVERYALELLFGSERSDDSELLAAELQLKSEQSALVALTTAATAADVAPYVGEYERGILVFRRGPDLILKTEFGELPARPVPGYPGAFLVVGNVLSGGVAQFSDDGAGHVVLTLGLLSVDGEDVSLLQPVTLAKRTAGARPHWPRFVPHAAADWRRVARHLHECGVRAPRTKPLR